ncbi:MAG TPA: septum formation initiator family protein [Vicinamibacterales bacterium]|nr:septum formation initiator family protein [Vicinamibacterales bacterium]
MSDIVKDLVDICDSTLYGWPGCCTVFTVVRSTTPPSAPRRRVPRERVSRGKRIARWAVVFFAVAVIVDAVVGDRGLLAMLQAGAQYETATTALDRQRAENQRLREQVDRLTNDPAAIEELARDELGLMRPGEKLFIVKDLKPTATR